MEWRKLKILWGQLALLSLFLASTGHTSAIELEAGSVIPEESEGRASFNVTNVGDEPILLISKVENLREGDISHRIVLTLPITRIDPKQSQLIHYILRKGEPLQEEHMLAASFEAVPIKRPSAAAINIRRGIAMMIYPQLVSPINEAWRDLTLTHQDGMLEMRNQGRHVVRLLPSISVGQEGTNISLEHAYLPPGDTAQYPVQDVPKHITIRPMNRRGSALPAVDLPVTTADNRSVPH